MKSRPELTPVTFTSLPDDSQTLIMQSDALSEAERVSAIAAGDNSPVTETLIFRRTPGSHEGWALRSESTKKGVVHFLCTRPSKKGPWSRIVFE